MPRCAKIKKQYGKLFNSSVLCSVYSFYPIISSQGVMDIEGNIYTGVAEVMDDPLIQKYQMIQYANLFDELDPVWFTVN